MAHIKRATLPDITQRELKAWLHYEPATGEFTWLRRCGRAGAGTVAGKRHNKGYTYIRVLRRDYPAHRLAWLWVHGELPPALIDHINHDRSDNRITNLRLATYAQNSFHKSRCWGKSGLPGVSANGRKWKATIGHAYLGTFETKKLAREARLVAARKLYGEFQSD